MDKVYYVLVLYFPTGNTSIPRVFTGAKIILLTNLVRPEERGDQRTYTITYVAGVA